MVHLSWLHDYWTLLPSNSSSFLLPFFSAIVYWAYHFIRHLTKQFMYIIPLNFHTSLREKYDCYLQLTNKEIKAHETEVTWSRWGRVQGRARSQPQGSPVQTLTSQLSHHTASSLNVFCSLSPGTEWERLSMLWVTLLGLGLSITSPSLSWTPLTPSTECMKILKWPRLNPFMMTWRTIGRATQTSVSMPHTTQ